LSAVSTPPSAAASRARSAAGAFVSLLALGAVVWWASKQGTPELPSGAGAIAVVVASALVYGLATVARGWRWHRILRKAEIPHARADAYALLPVGYMGNTVLPARGGELLRVFLLASRGDARRREVLGSIVSERVVDAATLVLLFAALTWAGVAGTPLGEEPALVAVALLAAGLAGIRVYLHLRRRGRLDAFAERVRPLVRAGRPLLGRGGVVLAAATIGIWMLEGAVLWLLGRSLSLDVTPVGACFVLVLSAFVSLIPAAPGYIGTYDAAVVFGLKGLGITGSQAVGFALLSRFVVFAPITAAGLALLVWRYGGLKRLTSR
jgi:glycosyltransferase 2 family protein